MRQGKRLSVWIDVSQESIDESYPQRDLAKMFGAVCDAVEKGEVKGILRGSDGHLRGSWAFSVPEMTERV